MKTKYITAHAVGICSVLSAVYAVAGPATAATTASAGNETKLEEVIVTAQRRAERYQDVAASVTVITSAALSQAGVKNMLDLGNVVPGLTMPVYGSYLQPSVRGVSSNVASIAESSNVATFIDGVYQASEFALNFDLPDVESIQVLKGPQGTLYGQNAAGGAIIIDTFQPSFTWKGNLSAGYGNHNALETKGFVTGPIAPTLAFSASAAYREHDGYAVDLLNGGHDKGLLSVTGRAKVLWQPSDDVSFTLAGNGTRRSDSSAYAGPALNGNTTYRALLQGFHPNVPLATYGLAYSDNVPPHDKVNSWGVSLISKFKVGDLGTITSISAYTHVDFTFSFDIDHSPVNYLAYQAENTDKYKTEELNFVSNKFNGITITAGAFFMDRYGNYLPNVTYLDGSVLAPPGATAPTVFPTPPGAAFPARLAVSGTVSQVHKQSYAGYAEVNWDLTDQLALTVAGRYSYETVRAWNTPLPATFAAGVTPLPALLPDPRGQFSFSKFTPKAVLRYQPDRNNSFYVSYSQGFKSGFVNTSNINVCTPQPTCVDAPVQPETVTAYELGYKGQLGDRFTLSAAAFHYLYKQIQIFIYNPLGGGSSYQNAAAGRINGAEFDASFRATDDLVLHLGASGLDAKYTKFTGAYILVPNATGGNTGASQDVSGGDMLRAPTLTLNGSADYTHEVDNVGRFEAYVATNYTSGSNFDPNRRIRQKAYALLDGEVSFAPAGLPGTRFVVWGNNLTNHLYLSSVLESTVTDAAAFGAPRTFGVRAEYKF